MGNITKTQKNKKLLFESYSADESHAAAHPIPAGKIDELKRNGVRTVFVVTSMAVATDSYVALVRQYREAGFRVVNIHLEGLGGQHLQSVKNAVSEIRRGMSEGSCFILSYGKSFAGVIITCFVIYTGKDADESIALVSEINDNLIGGEEEVLFIKDFQEYLRVHPIPEDAGPPRPYTAPDSGMTVKSAPAPFGNYTRPGVIKDAIPRIAPPDEGSRVEEDSEDILIPEEVEEKTVSPPSDKATGIREELKPEESTEIAEEARFAPVAEETVHDDRGLEDDDIEAATEEMISPPLPPETETPASEAVFRELGDYLGDETAIDDIPPVEGIEEFDSEYDDEKAGEPVVRPEPPEEKEKGEKPEKLRFGLFFTSLRFKLISIISIIIVLSLSGMIFLATYFFKKDNEVRVQENNHKVSEVIALKVSSDITSIIEKARLIREKLSSSRSSLIPGNDKDFIFIGIAVGSGEGGIKFIDSYYNSSVMELSQVSRADIRAVHLANARIFARSLNGGNVVHNISQGFGVPVIGISIPFQSGTRGGPRSILVSYIKLDRFLQTFKTTGITKAFLVNDRGDIVAHSDSTVVLSEANFINLPIVAMMTKSTLDNGQTRYRDENGVFHLGSFKKLGIGGCGVIATVDEVKAFQEVYNIQRRNIYLMIVVLTVVIMIVFFFGQSLTTPIIRLVGAAKKIKEGIYNVDIKPATRDEVGELTNAFIEMGAGLEEREKIKTAFGKFVNPELAELVVKDEVRLGGEKKTVSILFSDIRNFTAISEKLDPEEVVDFLNIYMTRMVACIDSTGGIVDKFIGDAIMAIWGVPVSKGNDTENAIDAALMMRRSLIEFNKNRGGAKNPIIKIGCGINTGAVLAGQIGSENRMEYTVIGDTVNLASRIEDLNKPFGTDILISEDTYNIVKGIYAVERMEPIKVKGKDEPQQIFAILGRLDDKERPETIHELRVILGLEKQPFNRRAGDREKGEVKYEILER